MRVLIAGWPSFADGEATAGDVASMQRVANRLGERGIAHDTAWSPHLYPEALSLERARPENYSHVIFACGPAHGRQVRELHQRYSGCRRVAVGVSVLDQEDPAVTGFHWLLPRDGGGATPSRDLAWPAAIHPSCTPVVGVVLAPGQGEYSQRRRHEEVHERLRSWLTRVDCAPVDIDTRLDTRDGGHCSLPEQCAALFARTDVVLTSRLHGLVFGLGQGKPVIAVDPVAGGAKVSAQAEACRWPAVIMADDVLSASGRRALDRAWRWCRSTGVPLARQRARELRSTSTEDLDVLLRHLAPNPPGTAS